MAKNMKMLRAGRYCLVAAYTRAKRSDSARARAEKKNHSSMAQQRLNDKKSCTQLTGIIAENFLDSKSAMFVTATFDAAHYPKLEKTTAYWPWCIAQAKNYKKRLCRLAAKRGNDIRIVYAPGTGEDGRWHLHMMISGATAEDVRDAWGLGNVDYHLLYSDAKWITSKGWWTKSGNVNPVAIAKYLMHNASARAVGQHPWHASRNCVRPVVTPTQIMPDGASIEPPDGSEILDRESIQTLYSAFDFIEYLLPVGYKPPDTDQ